jgi:hypothetical protein
MLAGSAVTVEQPEQDLGRDAPSVGEWLGDGCSRRLSSRLR